MQFLFEKRTQFRRFRSVFTCFFSVPIFSHKIFQLWADLLLQQRLSGLVKRNRPGLAGVKRTR